MIFISFAYPQIATSDKTEVVQDLPALNAHVHAGVEIPLTVPVLGDEVVNDDPVAVSGVIQRKGDVELVVPVAHADLVANLPVDPLHDLFDLGG